MPQLLFLYNSAQTFSLCSSNILLLPSRNKQPILVRTDQHQHRCVQNWLAFIAQQVQYITWNYPSEQHIQWFFGRLAKTTIFLWFLKCTHWVTGAKTSFLIWQLYGSDLVMFMHKRVNKRLRVGFGWNDFLVHPETFLELHSNMAVQHSPKQRAAWSHYCLFFWFRKFLPVYICWFVGLSTG